jgi:hypothetical protein
MADRLGCASDGRKIFLTGHVYMCDKTHSHYEARRIPRRRPTLVFAPGERTVAAGGRLAVVAHRAVYSRELLGLPARRGPRELCPVRAQQKPTLLGLRATGISSAGPTGGEQRSKARGSHARSWATVYRRPKGATSSPGFCGKEESEMITVRYQQRINLLSPLF